MKLPEDLPEGEWVRPVDGAWRVMTSRVAIRDRSQPVWYVRDEYDNQSMFYSEREALAFARTPLVANQLSDLESTLRSVAEEISRGAPDNALVAACEALGLDPEDYR
ncbi:MAG: hypothetical protein AAF196_09080 [Planctomycetota bacterium]